jgi:DnaJ-class molecular chaperone
VDDIRTAFRTVSRLFHPDRHPNDTPADAEDRRKQFLDVSDAKAILTCTILRPIYDLGGMPAVVLYRAAATPMEIDVFPMDASLKTMSYEEEIQGNRGLIV